MSNKPRCEQEKMLSPCTKEYEMCQDVNEKPYVVLVLKYNTVL